MKRYIDAEALLEALPDDLPYKGSVKRVLIQAHTADVVEVVRCRECKNYKTPRCAMWFNCSFCGGQWDWCSPNDFCSYGERKEQ